MQRIPVVERPDLKGAALRHGYEYSAGDGVPYWDETAYYRFALRQIEEDLEKPAKEIDAMCFQLLDRSLADETVYRRLRIPETYWDYVADSCHSSATPDTIPAGRIRNSGCRSGDWRS